MTALNAGTIEANPLRINRLSNPEKAWNAGFKHGEAVYDRLLNEIVFIRSISLGLDGEITCVELTRQNSQTFFRSPNSIRSLSLLERGMVAIEDRFLGGRLGGTFSTWKKITVLIIIIVTGYLDPASLLKNLFD